MQVYLQRARVCPVPRPRLVERLAGGLLERAQEDPEEDDEEPEEDEAEDDLGDFGEASFLESAVKKAKGKGRKARRSRSSSSFEEVTPDMTWTDLDTALPPALPDELLGWLMLKKNLTQRSSATQRPGLHPEQPQNSRRREGPLSGGRRATLHEQGWRKFQRQGTWSILLGGTCWQRRIRWTSL